MTLGRSWAKRASNAQRCGELGADPRRYVRGSEGLVRPNLGTHELTRFARAGRAEPHAKEDGPWTTIAWLTLASIRPRPSTPWPSRRAAERERCAISARSRY